MKIIGKSSPRGGRFEESARSGSRPIGGPREFATFSLLMLCLAATVAVVFGHGHRAVNGAKSQPAASAPRATAPHPSKLEPPIASGRDYAAQKHPAQDRPADDYAAWMTSTAGNLGNSAVNAENVVLRAVVSLVWDPAIGLSNQIVGYVADSLVSPVTGDRIIFNAAPGASHMAVVILAFAMVGVVMLALAGPLYASWKTWRLSRAHGFRNHPHED